MEGNGIPVASDRFAAHEAMKLRALQDMRRSAGIYLARAMLHMLHKRYSQIATTGKGSARARHQLGRQLMLAGTAGYDRPRGRCRYAVAGLRRLPR